MCPWSGTDRDDFCWFKWSWSQTLLLLHGDKSSQNIMMGLYISGHTGLAFFGVVYSSVQK